MRYVAMVLTVLMIILWSMLPGASEPETRIDYTVADTVADVGLDAYLKQCDIEKERWLQEINDNEPERGHRTGD